MNPQINTPELRVISSVLGHEICRPLDALQANLTRLLEDPDREPSAAERNHAITMLELCDDLRRLTWDCLGSDDFPGPAPPPECSAAEATVPA